MSRKPQTAKLLDDLLLKVARKLSADSPLMSIGSILNNYVIEVREAIAVSGTKARYICVSIPAMPQPGQ